MVGFWTKILLIWSYFSWALF